MFERVGSRAVCGESALSVQPRSRSSVCHQRTCALLHYHTQTIYDPKWSAFAQIRMTLGSSVNRNRSTSHFRSFIPHIYTTFFALPCAGKLSTQRRRIPALRGWHASSALSNGQKPQKSIVLHAHRVCPRCTRPIANRMRTQSCKMMYDQ